MSAPHFEATQRARNGPLTLACALCIALVAADAPATRTVTLRWQHMGGVAGFKVYLRHVDQPWGEAIDIGLPPHAEHIYEYEIAISNRDATYVALSSYDDRGVESERSNERLYLLPE